MTKTTLELDPVQRAALLFLLGGKHQTQLEPFQKMALDEVEATLRNVTTESESVVAPSEVGTVSPVDGAPAKGKRGRK